ncbi:MAG: tetratricopeptide repeat protein [Gammaproteobacteria bacterium]|nr:tetratricopeptide repeat protein [Gammaproteobacteria bacterium]
MKKLLIIMFFAGSMAVNAPVIAQGTATIYETSSHSVFKGLFKSVWAHLKSLSPTQKQSARSNQTYLAGIRGTETTETLLKPYWKDDLSQDKNFQTELERFSLAQYKMDQGDLETAVALFDGFLRQYEASDMRPNALFAKSISLANIGQSTQALAVMRQFVDENPNHPLLADARQIINLLN